MNGQVQKNTLYVGNENKEKPKPSHARNMFDKMPLRANFIFLP